MLFLSPQRDTFLHAFATGQLVAQPVGYWSLYGNGTFRKWRRDSLTGAHINIVQYPLSLSTRQILQQIEENYSPELLKYEVKIIH